MLHLFDNCNRDHCIVYAAGKYIEYYPDLIQGIFAIYETMSAKSELSDYGSMVQYGAGFYLLLIGGIVAFVGAIIGLVLHINAKKSYYQT